MTLVREFELAAKTDNELQGLLRKTFNELAKYPVKSPQRSSALATMENIRGELRKRLQSAP